jgi:hypothetical protein
VCGCEVRVDLYAFACEALIDLHKCDCELLGDIPYVAVRFQLVYAYVAMSF